MHRLAADEAGAVTTEQQEEASSSSYSAQQLLCRDSKKAASCRAVTFSADGSALLCGFETGSILQLDPETGKAKVRLTKAHQAGINRLTAIPDNPHLVAAGDNDGGLHIWDLRSQSSVFKYSKHKDFISCLTVTEKQQALLAVSGDGTLSVHDLRGCKALAHSETDADDELLSGAVLMVAAWKSEQTSAGQCNKESSCYGLYDVVDELLGIVGLSKTTLSSCLRPASCAGIVRLILSLFLIA